MRIGPREALLLAILTAVPLASFFLVFKPRNTEIAQAMKEIEHKRQMLLKVQESTARKETLEQQITDAQEKIRLIEAKLPTQKEVDAIVRSISDLAVKCGLQPPAIESEKPLRAALYMEQPLRVKIRGPFRDGDNGFYPFIVKLEDLPRITRIPTMKITRLRGSDAIMEAEFVLSIYYQPEGNER